jgi:hypothetical protein
MTFSIHTIHEMIFRVWRKQRFDLFLRLVKPSTSDTLLDVGGHPSFWTSRPQFVERIDTLNNHAVSWRPEYAPKHNIRILVGDGCSLAMPDQSYDIGFSNSVIEHVGSWESQQKFASEIRRVAKFIWVQTPAYECPIEPHYLALFIHYFPHWVQKKSLRWFTLWGWFLRPNQRKIDNMVDTTRLLRKSEVQILFPDCEIIVERILWIFPKSYIAIRRDA